MSLADHLSCSPPGSPALHAACSTHGGSPGLGTLKTPSNGSVYQLLRRVPSIGSTAISGPLAAFRTQELGRGLLLSRGWLESGMRPTTPGSGLDCTVLFPAVFGTNLFQSNCSSSPFRYLNYSIKEIQTVKDMCLINVILMFSLTINSH